MYMQGLRISGLLLALLALQARAAEHGTLKTGMQALPGALPAVVDRDPAFDWDFELPREKFYLHVPGSYAGNQPFGLLVYISPSDECAAAPPGWADVLREKKLIFVAAQSSGNSQPVSRRAGLALLAACKLQELGRIDTNRIYAAGLSGGARMASYVSFLRPALFSGVIAVCGVNFPGNVPRVRATKDDEYGSFPLAGPRVDEAKKRVKFVLVTGANDFRYGNILDIYTGGFQKEGFAVKLMDVPGMGHTICSPQALREAVMFLDRRMPAVPGRK
jgi:hypothetical protein